MSALLSHHVKLTAMKHNSNLQSKLLYTMLLALLTGAKAFSQDTTLPSQKAVIIMKDGKQVENAGLWEIQSSVLVYESDGNLHDALIADIEKIRMPDADYVFENDSLTKASSENFFSDSSQTGKETALAVPETVKVENRYRMGYNDAEKYYNGTGAAIGGFFSGFIPGLGWFITLPIIGATRPQMYNENNPNLTKLQDKDYRAGYKKNATNKKLTNVFGGFSLGLITFLALVL
jgi:hypothetical protein